MQRMAQKTLIMIIVTLIMKRSKKMIRPVKKTLPVMGQKMIILLSSSQR